MNVEKPHVKNVNWGRAAHRLESPPTAKESIRTIWNRSVPDYGVVSTGASAGDVLTGLVNAALDIVAYRRISARPESIHLVSADGLDYLKFPAAVDRTADIAVLLSHIISANAEEGNAFGELLGKKPPFRSLRIVVLSYDGDVRVNRLDLDPQSPGGVSWYGHFDFDQFNEIAIGFALFVTHMIANVFDDDDGQETFDESLEWIS